MLAIYIKDSTLTPKLRGTCDSSKKISRSWLAGSDQPFGIVQSEVDEACFSEWSSLR